MVREEARKGGEKGVWAGGGLLEGEEEEGGEGGGEGGGGGGEGGGGEGGWADGHLGQEGARGTLVVGGEVQGAGGHRGVGGQARLRLAVLFLLLVVVFVVGAFRVVPVRVGAVCAAAVVTVFWGTERRVC